MATRKTLYTATVDVDANAVGFVVGRGRINITNLKAAHPCVKLWISSNGPLTTFNLSCNSAVKLENCKSELEKLKYNGEAMHYAFMQRKRVEKSIEAQRQSILAGKRIRDSLENEMRDKQKTEIQHKLESNIYEDDEIMKSAKNNQLIDADENENNIILTKSNMFSGLEVD